MTTWRRLLRAILPGLDADTGAASSPGGPPFEPHEVDGAGVACSDLMGTLAAHAELAPAEVRLLYADIDPWAVHMVVRIADEPPECARHWAWSRDLYEAGLDAVDPIGLGDVRVWSTRRRYRIMLSSPDGNATISIARSAAIVFRNRMHELVPAGIEPDRQWIPDTPGDLKIGRRP